MTISKSTVEVLEFTVSNQTYALNVAKVLQITVFDEADITNLPDENEGLIGSSYFRETPIPVLDLKPILGVPKDEETTQPLLLVCQFSGSTVAFKIGTVSRIHRIEWDQFEELNQDLFDTQQTFVLGTIQLDNKVIMVLDVEGLVGSLNGNADFQASLDESQEESVGDYSILYAEDSSIVRGIAVSALRKAGITKIKEFPTAVEALRYLNDNPEEKIDFILSDVEMPGLDGLSFCQELKQTTRTAQIPFVFFSSLINDQMREKCKEVGAQEALAKPEVHRIVPLIKEYCAHK